MKLAAGLLLACIAVVSFCEGLSPSRDTEAPCPILCLQLYRPVCVRDGETLLWFTNTCMQRKCECTINRTLENVDMDDCNNRDTAPPRNLCPAFMKGQRVPPKTNPNVEDSQSLSEGED